MTHEARHLVNRLNIAVIAALVLVLMVGRVPWSGLFVRPVGVAYNTSTNELSLYRHTPFGGVGGGTELTLRTTGNITCSSALPVQATDDTVSDFYALPAPPALRPCLDAEEPVAVVWETWVYLAGIRLTPVVFDGLLLKVGR